MRPIHSRILSTGLWMALSVGSLAATGSSAFAADESIQTNANGEVLSHTSTAILQRQLAAHHAYQGKVDGVWGKQTEAALRNFQTKNKLDATGKVDAPTAEKLGVKIERMELAEKDGARTQPVASDKSSDVHSTSDDTNTSVQLSALSNAQAKEMQQRLQLLGYYKGPIDGAVGEGTRSALRKFFDHQANLASKGSVSNAAISLFGTQPNEIQRVNGTDPAR
jgi:peptidoglycan hydrolase-like protein with peptidoglycan-binding domain